MAELTFKSAGVSTREIDLSGPTPAGRVGIPAGVIGTALEGPAFVPITIANYSEFAATFGNTDGEKFGPLAVAEWLRNAQSCTYMRILGIGDGSKRDASSGIVNNAGFTVGDKLPQDGDGKVGINKFATDGAGSHGGRTYFLGCFMSESNGSTIFSEAGIQEPCIQSSVQITIHTSSNLANSIFSVTESISGDDGRLPRVHILTEGSAPNRWDKGANNQAAAISLATAIRTCLTGCLQTSTPVLNTSIGATPFSFTVNYASPGLHGNEVSIGFADPNAAADTVRIGTADAGINEANKSIPAVNLTGGSGGAIPIVRGVLMAPSGVILHLSGNSNASTIAPVMTETAATSISSFAGRRGGNTGSLDLQSQEFVMLMNGYKNDIDSSKLTHITASFDMTAPNYFGKVFNTDPLKIESEGHLLYAHYDVYPTLASVTGSGVVHHGNNEVTGSYTRGAYGLKQDIAFLLTSSISRVPAGTAAPANTATPLYESFEDRFSHASTPFITSQKLGRVYDLFNIVALSAGENVSNRYKISIENLVKATSDVDPYGTFDLVVRDFNDTDDEKKILESFRGVSLDLASDRFIGSVIGDKNIYYDFDNNAESQKLVVDGNYNVRSRYVRVALSDELKNNEVPEKALPIGFRGIAHINTSGSLLTNPVDPIHCIATGSNIDIFKRAVIPPVPMRSTISQGTGFQKRSDARLYWGIQTTRKTSLTLPNKVGLPDESFQSFTKYFPDNRLDTTIKFSVKNNPGVSDIAGTILDCDRFNNNGFSLEKIKVRTGSDGNADPDQWLSASYVRQGGTIGISAELKTRGFNVDKDLSKVSNRKFLKFTVPFQGGFNGTNIFNSDKSKFLNPALIREIDDDTAQGGTSGPTVAAYRKAVDIMTSKTDVDIKLLAIPGARDASITNYAINAIENRYDAMYIMDIEERDQSNKVITSSNIQSPNVVNTVTAFTNKSLDSSFAAAYFPDVVVNDPTTRTLVQVPPSVAVLGAYSLNDRVGHPWFAPAGFSRGALSSVEMANVRLNRTNLDDLYSAKINPITAFPGTGITIWGQKTLKAEASALDRVNVRRLLINVRRKVAAIANSLLFEPNREETLEKFSALVNPIMQKVQEQSGVDRYKVVIDTTTTTQADVENNTIRGKIFLQPTRSVEFVALDFVVTNAGSNI